MDCLIVFSCIAIWYTVEFSSYMQARSQEGPRGLEPCPFQQRTRSTLSRALFVSKRVLPID